MPAGPLLSGRFPGGGRPGATLPGVPRRAQPAPPAAGSERSDPSNLTPVPAASEQLPDLDPEQGVHGARGDLRQRFQDEAAQVHARMRDDEGIGRHDPIPPEEDVDIDGARPRVGTWTGNAASAEIPFDLEADFQELRRGQRRDDLEGGVEKGAISRQVHRGGLVQVRDAADGDSPRLESADGVPGGPGAISVAGAGSEVDSVR